VIAIAHRLSTIAAMDAQEIIARRIARELRSGNGTIVAPRAQDREAPV